jgi:hypothetical protein
LAWPSVSRPDDDNARDGKSGNREYLSKIQVLSDHNVVVYRSPVNDFGIGGARVGERTPRQNLKSLRCKFCLPKFREVDIEQQSHRGTKDSDSVSRQAA